MSVALDGGLPAAARPTRGCRGEAPSPVVFDCPHAARLQHSCRHGLGCVVRLARSGRHARSAPAGLAPTQTDRYLTTPWIKKLPLFLSDIDTRHLIFECH
ncbi:hypothetical protein AAC387_Pa02g3449 [Persea americana]